MAQAYNNLGMLNSFNVDSTYRAARHTAMDASIAPREDDYKMFSNRILEAYFHDASIIRGLAKVIDSTSVAEGKFQHELVELNDVGDAMVAMQAGEDHTQVTADTTVAKIPEIFKTAEMSDREWAMTIAGMNRQNIVPAMIYPKIAEAETVISFRGVTELGINGLISSATTDAGSPTGVWDVDTASDGRLTNFIKDTKAIKNKIIALTKDPLQKINAVMTLPIFELAEDTVYEESPEFSNLDWFRTKILRGGDIYVSNLIQANVSVDSNTIVMIPDVPENKFPFTIVTGGFDASVKSPGHFRTSLGIRQLFTINIPKTLGKLVHWMDDIDCET